MQATNLRITDEAKLTAAVAKGKKYADCADPSLSLCLSPLSFLEPFGRVRVPLPCLTPAEKKPEKCEPSWYLK